MTWQIYLQDQQSNFVEDLLEFVRIPSVSAVKEHFDDVVKAGNWVVSRLQRAGIANARMMATETHPIVYGDWMDAGSDKPTILIYGHFDVQPAEPFDLWDSPPFEPIVVNDAVRGRGASDDKGGMLIPILAAEALLASEGKLPVNVKFFFEGQEEIGSPTLQAFISQNGNLLKADMIFSADGGQWGEDQPSMITGLKGLVGCAITVNGATSDQHSGMHGGGIANPIHALSHIIASMKDLNGEIKVAGFYDDVVELSVHDRQAIAEVPFDEQDYVKGLGVPDVFGEEGFTTPERLWARPTLELNGIWGGYQGEGTKTVLPAKAQAKITCRLVANQSPEYIYILLKQHVEENTPSGVTAEVLRLPGSADPFLVPSGHNSSQIAAEVLGEVYGKKPYTVRTGGSIPVMSMLLNELGVHATVFAFGLDDEKIHAPNEFFRLASFRRGQEAYCTLLHKLGGTDQA